jgi:hypothetical protein
VGVVEYLRFRYRLGNGSRPAAPSKNGGPWLT